MDKKIAALLGAAATLATVGGANATEVQGNAQNPAASYRDLLNPVPKALDALKADDARLANTPADEVKLAQIGIVVGHHHHHHHHHQHQKPQHGVFIILCTTFRSQLLTNIITKDITNDGCDILCFPFLGLDSDTNR